MSYRKITGMQQPAGAEEFTRLLEAEWRNKSNEQQPAIIVEQPNAMQPAHLYVIWDAWKELSLQERSEIIMDVFEKVEGKAAAANVTVAMGLTEDEAQRFAPSVVRTSS